MEVFASIVCWKIASFWKKNHTTKMTAVDAGKNKSCKICSDFFKYCQQSITSAASLLQTEVRLFTPGKCCFAFQRPVRKISTLSRGIKAEPFFDFLPIRKAPQEEIPFYRLQWILDFQINVRQIFLTLPQPRISTSHTWEWSSLTLLKWKCLLASHLKFCMRHPVL